MKLANKLCQVIPNMPGDPAAVRRPLDPWAFWRFSIARRNPDRNSMDLGHFRRVFVTISAQNATNNARGPMKVANKLCQDIPNMPGAPAEASRQLCWTFGGLLLRAEILVGIEWIWEVI